MRIVSIQLPIRLGNIEKNLSVFKDAIAKVIDETDTIIILPEMWACGFDYENLLGHSDSTNDVLNSIQTIINDNTLIISSLPERNQNKVFNTVFALSKDGVIASYRKSFLFTPMGEDKYIDKGSDLGVFDFRGVRIGMLLCYEIRFPELSRMLAYDGADILVYPAIWPQIKKEHWLTLMRARAIENQCYAAGCNTSVMMGRKDMPCGYSAAVDPWGEALYEPSDMEGVYIAEMSHEKVKEVREKVPSFYDARDSFNIRRKNS